jgi:hypothetical protein
MDSQRPAITSVTPTKIPVCRVHSNCLGQRSRIPDRHKGTRLAIQHGVNASRYTCRNNRYLHGPCFEDYGGVTFSIRRQNEEIDRGIYLGQVRHPTEYMNPWMGTQILERLHRHRIVSLNLSCDH